MANCIKLLLLGVALAACLQVIYGHGKMSDPLNRSSLWRDNRFKGAAINYQDNQNYCGGYSVQHNTNGGKCGPCGDDYRDEIPRKNENGGIYGRGRIVKKYRAGEKIKVVVDLSANHLGHFEFNICQLKHAKALETEECFAEHPLKIVDVDGQIGDKYQVLSGTGGLTPIEVFLPEGFKCERCVLRWHYRAGNNWGMCEGNKYGRLGCGPQETFRSCSDIAIQ